MGEPNPRKEAIKRAQVLSEGWINDTTKIDTRMILGETIEGQSSDGTVEINVSLTRLKMEGRLNGMISFQAGENRRESSRIKQIFTIPIPDSSEKEHVFNKEVCIFSVGNVQIWMRTKLFLVYWGDTLEQSEIRLQVDIFHNDGEDPAIGEPRPEQVRLAA